MERFFFIFFYIMQPFVNDYIWCADVSSNHNQKINKFQHQGICRVLHPRLSSSWKTPTSSLFNWQRMTSDLSLSPVHLDFSWLQEACGWRVLYRFKFSPMWLLIHIQASLLTPDPPCLPSTASDHWRKTFHWAVWNLTYHFYVVHTEQLG